MGLASITEPAFSAPKIDMATNPEIPAWVSLYPPRITGRRTNSPVVGLLPQLAVRRPIQGRNRRTQGTTALVRAVFLPASHAKCTALPSLAAPKTQTPVVTETTSPFGLRMVVSPLPSLRQIYYSNTTAYRQPDVLALHVRGGRPCFIMR